MIVDDQLALAAALGILEPPGGSAGPVQTTYVFFIRMLQPAVPQQPGRPKRSALKDVLDAAGIAPDQALETLASPAPERLRVLDPTGLAAETVVAREAHSLNLLAAEVIGAALSLEEPIRFSANNAAGNIHRVATELGMDISYVELELNADGMLRATPVD